MRTSRLLWIMFLISVAPVLGADDPGGALPKVPAPVNPRVALSRLPMSFEPNVGQTDGQVKVLTRGPGYNLFLTPDKAVLSLGQPRDVSRARPASNRVQSVVRVELAGANPKVELAGEDELPGKSNYFIGNDPQAWHTDVPNYAQVRYQGLYRGVDLVYYGRQGALEYDFVVAPGGDPRQIRFRITGADKVKVDNAGNLVLTTEQGLVTLRSPQAYQ